MTCSVSGTRECVASEHGPSFFEAAEISLHLKAKIFCSSWFWLFDNGLLVHGATDSSIETGVFRKNKPKVIYYNSDRMILLILATSILYKSWGFSGGTRVRRDWKTDASVGPICHCRSKQAHLVPHGEHFRRTGRGLGAPLPDAEWFDRSHGLDTAADDLPRSTNSG